MVKGTDKPVVMSAVDKLKTRALATKEAKKAQTDTAGAEQEILIPLDKIKFDPKQPRKAFHTLDGRVADKDSEAIVELAGTIKEQGLIQAVTVQQEPDGSYKLLVGERRVRAHLYNGEAFIRARIENKEMSDAARLIYQIVENVDRENLTDEELAASILYLKEFGNDGKPMKQVDIAAKLKKEESWVSRYVRFGDADVHRIWVESGIANAVEIAYHLSNLSKPLQIDILRRVDLPEGDKERLEIPFTRKLIDQFREQDKIAKNAGKKKAVEPGAGNQLQDGDNLGSQMPPSRTSGWPFPESNNAGAGADRGAGGGKVAGNDPTDLAFQQAATEGRQGQPVQSGGNQHITGGENKDKYHLSPEDRQKLLGNFASSDVNLPRVAMPAPVNCRVSVRNLAILMNMLQEDPEMLESAYGIHCELNVPSQLAKQIANKLAGIIVDDQQVASTMQTEIAKLV